MTSIAQRKAMLEKRLADLGARLEGIEEELESHADPDWDEMALEREADEVLESLGVSGQQEMRMIRAALDRIAAGEYGHCAKCGTTISAERLDAVPYTPFCRNCAT
jgi:RNA polymerase-binding transcription factor DksA